MKLMNIRKNGDIRLGIVTEAGVVDLQAVAQKLGVHLPQTTDELIQGGSRAATELKQVLDKLAHFEDRGDFFVSASGVEYGPALVQPEKIVCVGTNYRKHALEANMPIPQVPVLFSKFNNTLAGHNDSIRILEVAKKVDYEVELVIVIGKTAQSVSVNEALDYVFGYCTGNDLSARDLQLKTGQWLIGKSLDGFAPLGPYLVSADEIPNPNDLKLETRVNGELRQSSNTKDMIFNCAELISYISCHMTLKPGDIIFTGTPEGVILGYPEDKQIWLQAGDEVVVSIETLGELRTMLI